MLKLNKVPAGSGRDMGTTIPPLAEELLVLDRVWRRTVRFYFMVLPMDSQPHSRESPTANHIWPAQTGLDVFKEGIGECQWQLQFSG